MTFLLRLIVALAVFGLLMRGFRALARLGSPRQTRRVRQPRSKASAPPEARKNGLKVSPDDVIDVPYDEVP